MTPARVLQWDPGEASRSGLKRARDVGGAGLRALGKGFLQRGAQKGQRVCVLGG